MTKAFGNLTQIQHSQIVDPWRLHKMLLKSLKHLFRDSRELPKNHHQNKRCLLPGPIQLPNNAPQQDHNALLISFPHRKEPIQRSGQIISRYGVHIKPHILQELMVYILPFAPQTKVQHHINSRRYIALLPGEQLPKLLLQPTPKLPLLNPHIPPKLAHHDQLPKIPTQKRITYDPPLKLQKLVAFGYCWSIPPKHLIIRYEQLQDLGHVNNVFAPEDEFFDPRLADVVGDVFGFLGF